MTLPYDLNILDVVLLAVLSLFALRGVLRGSLAEVAGLIGLLMGIWLAGHYYGQAGLWLTRYFNSEWVYIVAYVLILCLVMVAISLIARLMHAFLKFAYADWLNHLAGGVVGGVKGLLCAIVIVSLLGLFLADSAMVKQSKMVPVVRSASAYVRGLLPPSLGVYLK